MKIIGFQKRIMIANPNKKFIFFLRLHYILIKWENQVKSVNSWV